MDQDKTGTSKYEDIINLPHHVSSRHPQMSMQARAGQFSPFDALTGLDDEIDKTAEKAIEKVNALSTAAHSKL